MSKRVLYTLVFGVLLAGASSLTMVAQAKQMKAKPEADLPLTGPDAMKNIDKAMKMMMGSEEDQKMMMSMMMKAQEMAVKRGETLFNDEKLGGGKMGRSCNSCHPGGGTTGGEAEISKMHGYGPFKVPIPSLIGATGKFPKFKAPNAAVVSLASMNNNCIAMFVGGERLALNGKDAYALEAYMGTLK